MDSGLNQKSIEKIAKLAKSEKLEIRVVKEGPSHLGNFLAENVWYCVYAIAGNKCFQCHEQVSIGEDSDMYIKSINKAYDLKYLLGRKGISAELVRDWVCPYLDIDL